MQKTHQKLVNKKVEGKYLFVYANKYNLYFFLQNLDSNSLFCIMTNKNLDVLQEEEVVVPPGFLDYDLISFFKPTTEKASSPVFNGIWSKDEHKRFKITDGVATFSDPFQLSDYSRFNLISCLNDYKINSYIQKRDTLFVTGIDLKCDEPIYGIIDLTKNQFTRIYYLHSDLGDIMPKAIGIDTFEGKTYIVGSITSNDDGGNVKQIPYMESFLLQ